MITIDSAEFQVEQECWQVIRWRRRHGGDGVDTTKAIEADHTAALKIEACRNAAPSHGPGITFPAFIEPPTPCRTRTFSIIIPKVRRFTPTRHGAIKIVTVFPNRPTITAPRIGLPGFYTKWADEK